MAIAWVGADRTSPLRRAGQRQAQRVEQDRFAGAGLAREHAQAGPERQVEPVDQHQIANGKAEQHGRGNDKGAPRPTPETAPANQKIAPTTSPNQPLSVLAVAVGPPVISE